MTGYVLLASLWGFSFFGFNDFGPTNQTTTPETGTYYLLAAGTTDTLTTPTGDKIKLAGH